MAWTLALIGAIISLAIILLILSKSFDKSKHAIKTFLVLLVFGTLVLLAQVAKVIIENKASGSLLTSLSKLSTAALIMTIAIFFFFASYALINYTISIVRTLRDAKKQKEAEEFGL